MLSDRMNSLLRERVPFVRVTVVRAQKPTSVRAGNEAIVLGNGSIEGYVGGVCAEESVRAAALDALADGETLLLRVLPDENEPFPASPGAKVVRNPCLSGGAMEMFLEPLLPPPLIAIAGESPIARALAVMAPSVGFAVELDGGYEGALAVIVSSMGQDEHRAIRAALAAGVPLVGLVASPRRGSAVLDELQLSWQERDRIRTPMGLWIGAKTPEEIALSILAELIKAVRLDGLAAPEPASESTADAVLMAEPQPVQLMRQAPVTVTDPICGMTVTPGPGVPHIAADVSPDGEEHWFCSTSCRDRFASA